VRRPPPHGRLRFESIALACLLEIDRELRLPLPTLPS
jgi:hypothetical protein